MKKILSLVFVAMLTMAASAQITWNAKGGLGLATCYGDATEGLKNHIVGKIGAGIEYPFSSNLSLMPSLEFALKGTTDGENTLDLYYLQVPVVVAYRINLTDEWNLALKAGPYFAYTVSDKISPDNASLGAEKFDAGIDAGIDFEHHRFVFGVETEIGVCKLASGVNAKNLAFYATIGWKF